MINFSTLVLGLATISTALIAGLFYSYSVSVNPGLGKLSDSEYIAAMQSINIAIINPLFMLSFLGTVVLLPLSGYVHFSQPFSMRFMLIALASAVYIAGTFGVTIFGNVPLNDALAAFDLRTATQQEIAIQRQNFEAPWNQLHAIRTAASVISLILIVCACLTTGDEHTGKI